MFSVEYRAIANYNECILHPSLEGLTPLESIRGWSVEVLRTYLISVLVLSACRNHTVYHPECIRSDRGNSA